MQNFYPNQQMGYGFNPNQAQMPTVNNLISDEQIKLIKSESNGLNIGRSAVDQARSLCTHKYNGRGTALVPTGNGLYKCTICGTVMNIPDYTTEQVTEITSEMSDIIHNIKHFVPYISPEIGRSLYQAFDMIEVVPRMWDYMLEYKNKMWNAAGSMPYTPNYQQNTINQMYNLMNPTGFGGMMGGNPFQPQPGYFGQPQGGFGQAPMPGQFGQPQMMPTQPPMPGQFGDPAAPQMMPVGPNMMQTPGQAPMPGQFGQPQMMPVQPMMPGQMYGGPMAQPVSGGIVNPTMDRPVGVVEPAPQPGMVQQTGVAVAGPAPQQKETVKKNFKS